MFSFKRSLLPLANLVVLVVALAVLLSPAGPAKEKGLRTFYLTQTELNGSQALTACAEGYHMASLWEIFDTSNLKYNTALGLTTADSGSGPPNHLSGWIRTGFTASVGNIGGQANCNAWTTDGSGQSGTAVSLSARWEDLALGGQPGGPVSPWTRSIIPCNQIVSVWCVQD